MKLPYSKYKIPDSKFFIVKQGFTLIELLIVITIIGILVATGTYSWQSAQIKARDSRRKSDLKAIQQALESYFQSNGQYPPNGVTSCSDTQGAIKTVLEPAYITALPKDPTAAGTTNYYYNKISASSYQLYAILENIKDPEYIAVSACNGSGAYHYLVTNP